MLCWCGICLHLRHARMEQQQLQWLLTRSSLLSKLVSKTRSSLKLHLLIWDSPPVLMENEGSTLAVLSKFSPEIPVQVCFVPILLQSPKEQFSVSVCCSNPRNVMPIVHPWQRDRVFVKARGLRNKLQCNRYRLKFTWGHIWLNSAVQEQHAQLWHISLRLRTNRIRNMKAAREIVLCLTHRGVQTFFRISCVAECNKRFTAKYLQLGTRVALKKRLLSGNIHFCKRTEDLSYSGFLCNSVWQVGSVCSDSLCVCNMITCFFLRRWGT